MTIYTVHTPPPLTIEATPDPERFVFVRDGFYFWAFIFAPVWMLWQRLWLVLLFYIVGTAVLQVGLWLIGTSAMTHTIVGLLISLLVGLEAATLRRWTLNQNGWTQLGVVAGGNHEAAERRFFDVWLTQMAKPGGPAGLPPPLSPAIRISPAASDIVGLFPEPQSRQ